MANFASHQRNYGSIAESNFKTNRDMVFLNSATIIDAARVDRSQTTAKLILKAGKAVFRALNVFSLVAIQKFRQYNQTMDELQKLSDYMLSDIGVRRGMIPEVAYNLAYPKQDGTQPSPSAKAVSENNVKSPSPINCNEIDNNNLAA